MIGDIYLSMVLDSDLFFFFRNVLYIDGVRLLEILFMSSDRLSTDELQILQAAALGVVL